MFLNDNVWRNHDGNLPALQRARITNIFLSKLPRYTQDYGKTVDYIDDYSAYMDQELLSAVDGLTHNNSQEYCNHVFYCGVCNVETEVVVKLV